MFEQESIQQLAISHFFSTENQTEF